MSLRFYPHKSHVRKIIKEYMVTSHAKDFFKNRGILIVAQSKNDIAKLGADFYFSNEDFVEFKQRLESEENYKRSGRIHIPHDQAGKLQDALLVLQSKNNVGDQNTKVKVIQSSEEKYMFEITYEDQKPGMIDLLDITKRKIAVEVNKQDKGFSLDFNLNGSNDYKKLKEVLELVREEDEDVQFDFSEVLISVLPIDKRIELFDKFLRYDHSPWNVAEIIKLKVKKASKEHSVTTDELHGINAAVLDGTNLRANKFVQTTLDSGFYFSMSTMRLDHRDKPTFIDIAIDFKTRPEMCEIKLVSSGYYEDGDDGKPTSVKKVLDSAEQDRLLFEFKNILYEIFIELKSEVDTSEIMIDLDTPDDEVAAASE